ncbi:DNA recombination protein RmuC [Flavobacteriaceae bacterium]|uniref:DNA recombination protein RmuC n=1 Tax=Candidatus Arcticimaribacter forsetii TaxID=2820661 RepID=UPI0020774BCD|nr:DNA recombination protein RmuC [Candidatus Arcticimaribacter forsetii]MDA8699141.1 DNA recombination protein RmuC [Flavobacteriaceae bacterium]MDB2328909.1 DNA recombination protein RmuC [Flavobacteriaceae bacterium]MDB2345207.1 DNA recombination protein RmuC [Flavobacteriaceae bacterium]MDB4620534.1 DNA recombination protein RmuC [Flavobacteriaceae bacterium]
MLILNTVLALISLGGVIYLIVSKSNGKNSNFLNEKVTESIRGEFSLNREEFSKSLKDNRQELTLGLERLTEKMEQKLVSIIETLKVTEKESRVELKLNLKEFQDSFSKNVKEFNELQRLKFDQMNLRQEELVKMTESRLEKMRETVDEKLHKTLEERLGKSFEIVTNQLLEVQKGLGEMQNLASGVGDLKKVLSNVKTRGILGEIQLGNILEQILSPEQYDSNVKTKKGSDAHVEFAIKLPGKGANDSSVYLPIDAKFPQEDYARLQTAYDIGDTVAIEASVKSLVQSVKRFAKEISSKYIDPPHTTDFGIMFLPIEGLFAEVVRQPNLITELQRDYKIVITGPTTLAAMLNSLQMGFKTLAIQKRSSEVWNVLSSIKKEFTTFGGVLEKAQKKLNEANKEIETLVTTRSRMMLSKLRNVEQLEGDFKEEQPNNIIDFKD